VQKSKPAFSFNLLRTALKPETTDDIDQNVLLQALHYKREPICPRGMRPLRNACCVAYSLHSLIAVDHLVESLYLQKTTRFCM